jgi:hypothetical protein
VLCVADMYLLSGLKRGCGALLASSLNIENVVSRLKTARLFQLLQLEDQCIRFISLHIDKVPVCVMLLYFQSFCARTCINMYHLGICILNLVRFEVFTVVTMKNDIYWDVTPCGSVRTDISEERSASFIRVTRLCELRKC